jgi:DNA-directed RNA polymerase II subunit RPB7
MGFFADCGPVTIFVSNHLIPQELEFINNTYTNSVDHTIQKGEWLRIKIVGTRVDAKEIFAIGTIKEDYLGLIEEEL